MLTFFEPNHFAIADQLQAEYKTFMERHMDEQVILIYCETRKSRQRFFSDYPHFEIERDKIYKADDAVRAFNPFNAWLAQQELINDIKRLRDYYKSSAILITHSRLNRKLLPDYLRPSFASMRFLSDNAFTEDPISGHITCNANAHEILNLVAYKADHDDCLFPSTDLQESRLGIHRFYDNWLSTSLQARRNQGDWRSYQKALLSG